MTAYVLRRLLLMVPVLWLVATITFVLMHLTPGSPVDPGNVKNVPPDFIERMEERYQLNEPLFVQYVAYMGTLLRGDLGESFQFRRPVTEVIRDRLPVSVELGVCAFVFALAVGITLGVTAACRPGGPLDVGSVLIATVGAAVPGFVAAAFLVTVFSLQLGWFDVLGWEFGNPRKMVLPVLALGLFPASFIARITRAAMLEVLNEDYIRTARAKGLAEFPVVARHAMRNAMIPVLTISGPILASLITGSFVIERIFAITGLGQAYIQAIGARDYGMIMGTTLFIAALISFANLAVDIAYGIADPRIRVRA